MTLRLSSAKTEIWSKPWRRFIESRQSKTDGSKLNVPTRSRLWGIGGLSIEPCNAK
jgi:hypothetical protein